MMAIIVAPPFPTQPESLQVEKLIVPGDDELSGTIDTRVRPEQLTVKFFQTLDVTGGATGVDSASNPANWQLLSGDADVSHLISGIEVDGDTATLHLHGPLSAGTFRLRLGDNLQSASGAAIADSNRDNPYAVELPPIHVLPFVETAPTSSLPGEFNGREVSLYRLQVDAQGNYAVLFKRYEFDAESNLKASVRLQRFSSVGEKLGEETLITTQQFAGPADFAMNSSGEFVVSWRRPAGETDLLSVRRFNSTGAPMGSALNFELPRNGWSTFRVAIDDAGRAVFVWTTPDLTGERVWAQRIATDGTREGQAILVGFGSNPLVIKNGAGDFAIAWSAPYGSDVGVLAQRFHADGTLRGSALPVDSAGNRETLQDLDVDPSGGFAIATTRFAFGVSEVRLRRYDSEGQLREPLRTLLSNRSVSIYYVQLAWAPDGKSILRWSEIQRSQSELPPSRSYTLQFASIFDPASQELAAPFVTDETFAISASGRIVSVQDHKPFSAVTNGVGGTDDGSQKYSLLSHGLFVSRRLVEGIFMRHLRFSDLSVIDLNGEPDGNDMKINFMPGGSPVRLADAEQLTVHSETGTLNSVTITIEGFLPGDVLLTYSTNPNILWAFNAGVLTLTGVDTVANYRALLSDIWYTTSANRPAGSKVNVRFVANDGQHASEVAYALISIHVPGRSSIAGRQIFYNDSTYDGDDPSITSGDDAAVATDKTALLPGQTATKNNVTSYTRGINGIMVDLAGSHGEITVDDFIFRIGNSNAPAGWAYAPTPSSIVIRPGAGVGGSDRVEITWADGAIQDTWLQVIVLDNGDTGLADPDTFYFGNRAGDSGNESNRAQPQSNEALQVINRLRSVGANGVDASISDPLDFDRNGRINTQDLLAVFNAIRAQKDALNMIRAPGGQAGMNGAIITGGLEATMYTYTTTALDSNAVIVAAFADWSDDDASEARLPLAIAGPLLEDPDEN